MNFQSVLDLLRTVSTFHAEVKGNLPKLCVYETKNMDEGYVLCVRKGLTDNAFLKFLVAVAEARNLGIKEFRGHLILYSVYGDLI
jgi:hypothetical protein